MMVLWNRDQKSKPNGERNFCPSFVIGKRSRNIFKRIARWFRIRWFRIRVKVMT